MSESKQVSHQKGSNQSSDITSSLSSAGQKTTETVSSAGANIGAQFSGAFSAGGQSHTKTTTTESGGISKSQADRQYEERIEDEYAKREGGA